MPKISVTRCRNTGCHTAGEGNIERKMAYVLTFCQLDFLFFTLMEGTDSSGLWPSGQYISRLVLALTNTLFYIIKNSTNLEAQWSLYVPPV